MAAKRITDCPEPADMARFRPEFGQRFILTVDTEEEFDWNEPFDRSSHSVHSVPRLGKFQEFCEAQGVCPIYLVDYPVATSAAAADVLREPLAAGRAEIGLQLHPWVNPPLDEELSASNSYAGNLPKELEAAKFNLLRDRITANFGQAPLIYRAGRYGVGPDTAQILRDAGVAIDTSVRARFSYSEDGGPDYRDRPIAPWWIGGEGVLLELPLTTVYWGMLRQLGQWLYPAMWRIPRLRGLLARMGLLERIPLTPEGISLEEAVRGIDIAIDEGLPILVFSFHSPSLAPGHTPYVRSEDDLDAFYDWWRGVFAYLARRNIAPCTVREIMASVALASDPKPS